MTSAKTSARKLPPPKAAPARKAPAKRPGADASSRTARASAPAQSAETREQKPLALDEPHTEKASAEQSPWFKRAFEAGAPVAAMPGMPAMPAMPQMPPLDLASLGQSWKTLAGLTVPPQTLTDLQATYMKQAAAIWNQAMGLAPAEPAPPPSSDKRFAAPEWNEQPGSAFTASMYLLNARTMMRLADSLQGDVKTRQRIRFAVEQFVSAASPTNSLALNPQALKLAIDTRGESLAQGMAHLVADMKQGHMSQTDESVFEVGRNVATTEGSVVFENELFQLLDYKPLTPKVYERPLLMIPPCINKFYILDLQPDNSLIRHTVEQGHRVFVLSWRNVDDSQAQVTWDDYIEDAAIAAIDKVREISGMDTINTLGFCVGGTILATALAVMKARGEDPAESMTLLTTLLDFGNTGVLDLFIDEQMVRSRETALGPESPNGGNLLKGQELATTFSFLRPNDLVWNYVVGNYLKGETPPAFDLLYWNSDSTNLPGPMYTWYLRNTYLENKLKEPGATTVCGVPLDLASLDLPTYVYASREDHIVPWDSAYQNTKVVGGESRFVLGASGHIAGVINPPAKKKRNYWVAPAAAARADGELDPAQWFEQAEQHPGSWWPDWMAWLTPKAGRQVPAPKQPGNADHPAIEPAPGSYVKQKA